MVHEGRHVREVAEQQHGGRALHGFERAEQRVTREKDPLAHYDDRLAREPAVHLGHDRAHLLVAHENGLDVARVVERVEDAAGVAARHAEDELDTRFLEDADERVWNVDLVGDHRYFQSCLDASRAPAAIDLNLAHVISGSTMLTDRAKVAKPQSVPAITRSRPTISA